MSLAALLDRMFVLLPMQATTNYSVRGLLPQLIQDIVVIQAFTEAQKSKLLGAFYPGYIVAMLPAGWAVQKYGPKLLLSADNYVQGLALLLTPTAAKLGVAPLYICLVAMGISQAPIFPGQSVMKRDFQGRLAPEIRPWAIQFMRLSAAAGEIFSKYTTPIISLRYGWQMVCYVYGCASLAFAVIWGVCARSKPVAGRGSASLPRSFSSVDCSPSPVSDPDQGDSDESPAQTILEYRVLGVPAAVACMAAHASCNNLGYTVTQWAPTYYASIGCDTLTTGKHLACTGVVRFVGNFISASLESALQRLGYSQILIRRVVCLVVNSLQGAFCLGFGVSSTPLMATLMNCGICLCDSLQGICFSQNYYEVGGPDTAILTSVGNVFASLGGWIAPSLGAVLINRTGRFGWLFLLSAIIHWVAGVNFYICASAIPARQLLYETRLPRK